MLNLIVIVSLIVLVTGLPPVVPHHESYCVANGFSSDSSNTVCTTVDAFITETDLLNNGMAFKHYNDDNHHNNDNEDDDDNTI